MLIFKMFRDIFSVPKSFWLGEPVMIALMFYDVSVRIHSPLLNPEGTHSTAALELSLVLGFRELRWSQQLDGYLEVIGNPSLCNISRIQMIRGKECVRTITPPFVHAAYIDKFLLNVFQESLREAWNMIVSGERDVRVERPYVAANRTWQYILMNFCQSPPKFSDEKPNVKREER